MNPGYLRRHFDTEILVNNEEIETSINTSKGENKRLEEHEMNRRFEIIERIAKILRWVLET